jgi:1-deoxy-D-xylulose-5-phosphate synthase
MKLLQVIDAPAELRRLPRAQLPALVRQLRQRLPPSAPDAVELAVALHYVFDTPRDRIVWDGQRHDDGGVLAGQGFCPAHPSTSISAALGIAQAARLRGDARHAVAVIGNDAMRAGIAFEALNNAGVAPGVRLLVVLNDTDGSTPAAALAETLGLVYAGPVDGCDVGALVAMLESARQHAQPQLLHVVTRKSRRVAPAQAGDGYDAAFGDWLCDMAAADPCLVAVTPARAGASGMTRFAESFPGRCFEVGGAQQHAVTFAGGMAAEGLKPVVAIDAAFLQRAYDQLIHDIALQRLDLTFAIAGRADSACLRCIPNMVLMAPSDEDQCRRMLVTAYRHPGPAAVRYPRGAGPGVAVGRSLDGVEFGRGARRRAGRRTAILAFGAMLAPSLAAGGDLGATVADMRFIKPIDTALVLQLACEHDHLVTVEEGAVTGGAGAAVAEALAGAGVARPLLMLGLDDAPGARAPDAAAIARAIRLRFPSGQERQVANDG